MTSHRDKVAAWPLAVAFALMWLPYQAAVGLQERYEQQGAFGPTLMVVSLLLAWPLARWLRRSRGEPVFGLRPDRRALMTLLGGLVIAFIGRMIVVSIGDTTGASVAQSFDWTLAASVLPLLLLSSFIPSLAEDILTRGFPLFAARWRTPTLIVASALIYTANHIWRFDWGLTEQIRLFALGLAFAAAAWRLGSLWPAVGLHWGWNVAGALMPADILAVDQFRMLTAGFHVALFALIMVLPGKTMRAAANPPQPVPFRESA